LPLRRLPLRRFANGDEALPALINARRFFAAATIALRPAALSFRFGFAGAAASAMAGGLRDPEAKNCQGPRQKDRYCNKKVNLLGLCGLTEVGDHFGGLPRQHDRKDALSN
jgi:hypothetical protein